MNPDLARKTIRETFRQKFDDARFLYFIRNLVNPVSVTFDESKKQTWTLKKAAFEDYVNHFTRLGTHTDPGGEKVDVLVIHLRKETTLARGRMGWRARYLKEVDAHETTVRFWQEIYDDQGRLVEIHEKYPVDKGHQKV